MFQSVLALLLFLPIIVESSGEWTYDNPKQWRRVNRYCVGKSQSPIDLRFDVSQHDRRLKQISFHETTPREQAELINNGHTVQLSLKNHYLLKNVAPESEDYKVEQLHFHWGHSSDNTNGSEHTYEGKSYPLEMHVVTYSNWYSSIRDAMTNTRGLAVVGAFFELSEEPNPLLQPLVDALQHIRTKGQGTPIGDNFNLKKLIGEDRLRSYYRYDGSLTTPPCYESVVWTVLTEPIKISLTQLHAFRYLHDDHAKLISNTYRAVQPLGTRKVFRSFSPKKDGGEEVKQRMGVEENNGQYLAINMNLIVVLTGLLMIVL